MPKLAMLITMMATAASAPAVERSLHVGAAVGLSEGKVYAQRFDGIRFWDEGWLPRGAFRLLGGASIGRVVVALEPGVVSVEAPPDYGDSPAREGFRLDYVECPLTVGIRIGKVRGLTVVAGVGAVYAYRVGVAPGSGYATYTKNGPYYWFSAAHIRRLARADPGLRLSLTIEGSSNRLAPVVGIRYTNGYRNLDPGPEHMTGLPLADTPNTVTTRRIEVLVGVVRRSRRTRR